MNQAQILMQVDLPIKFFPPFFKYHVVFQDQLEDYICEDDMIDMIDIIGMIDMIEVTVL